LIITNLLHCFLQKICKYHREDSVKLFFLLITLSFNSAFAATKINHKAIAAEAMAIDAPCFKCHKEVAGIYQTRHGVKGDERTPTCTECHGEGKLHIDEAQIKKQRMPPEVVFGSKTRTFPPSEVKAQNGKCLTCHEKDAKNMFWIGSAHQVSDVACTACHKIHGQQDKVRERTTQMEVCFTCHKEQRNDLNKMSHHPTAEGKVICSDCHNVHGTTMQKSLLRKNSIVETCYVCHADRRGPFLWEHQPVTENCANCHNPHGSNYTPMLKSRTPFLCQECHDGPHESSRPVGANAGGMQAGQIKDPAGGATGTRGLPSESFTGRGCLNCHALVHGSNSPNGALLHR
jgi:DmsE family decaheme c-type cytochrome